MHIRTDLCFLTFWDFDIKLKKSDTIRTVGKCSSYWLEKSNILEIGRKYRVIYSLCGLKRDRFELRNESPISIFFLESCLLHLNRYTLGSLIPVDGWFDKAYWQWQLLVDSVDQRCNIMFASRRNCYSILSLRFTHFRRFR
jgi:hypothetical protein